MVTDAEWIDITLGRISEAEAKNIARELRQLWLYVDTVYPGGDLKRGARLKITKDNAGQYHFYLNRQALVFILLFCKNLPKHQVNVTEPVECPPEVPDFLRWDRPSDSKPE